MFASIRRGHCDEQIDDHTTTSTTLFGNASYEDIVSALDKLESEADAKNHEMYKRLCEIVRSHVEYMKENGIDFVDDDGEDW